jgi:hypothetical protein
MKRLAILLVAACHSVTASNPDAGVTSADASRPTDAYTVDSGTAIVPRYSVLEATLTWPSAGYTNPWEQVDVTVTLTSPTGGTVTIGGFYYDTDTWKFRYAPADLGGWSWSATISDGTNTKTITGSFQVIASSNPGFVRASTDNPLRWVFDDGTPYDPIGLGDCVTQTTPGDPTSILGGWGLDGTSATVEKRTDIETYLAAYQDAGFNLFRWSVNNCSFDLQKTIDPAGDVFDAEAGVWGDTL